MITRGKYVAILCAGLFLISAPLGATMTTFEFSGTFSTVHDKSKLLGSPFEKGAEFSGTYWIDTDKLNAVENSLTKGNKNSSSYQMFEGDNKAYGVTFSVGDKTFTSGEDFKASLTSYTNGQNASLSLYTIDDGGGSGNTEYFSLSFQGRKNALNLTDDPLLLGGVDLGDKNISTSFYYVKQENSGKKSKYGYAVGSLGSMNVVSGGGGGDIPEPATLAVLILGGGILLVRRKWHSPLRA